MTAPKPGWYPDPAGTAEMYRWWDGQDWTLAISETPHAAPPAEPPPVAAAPAPVSEEASEDVLEVPAEVHDVPAELREDPTQRRDVPRRRSPLRIAVALVLGFAVFASAGLGLGLVVWRDAGQGSPQDRPLVPEPRPSMGASASGAPAPTGRFDSSTGEARIGRVSMTLPRTPYEAYQDAAAVPGAFDLMFAADARVHTHYDGSRSWSATVALVHLDPSLTPGKSTHDVKALTAAQAVTERFFGGHPTTISDVSVSDRSVDGYAGLRVTLRARYDVPKLKSAYDDVTVQVVVLEDNTMVAAMSTVPDDADPELRRMAAASLETLTVS